MKSYAGIGSRKTPDEYLCLFEKIARRLNELGYTLRSGGAIGADSAFERGAGKKEIFVISNSRGEDRILKKFTPMSPEYKVASSVHPNWLACSEVARQLHCRNVNQILGQNLDDPSEFVICWTPCGAESTKECSILTGGTATAIKIAHQHNIPVFNFGKSGSKERFYQHIKEKQHK